MIPVRHDKSATDLRLLARLQKSVKVVLRLLGIAHILEGRGREESASLGSLRGNPTRVSWTSSFPAATQPSCNVSQRPGTDLDAAPAGWTRASWARPRG